MTEWLYLITLIVSIAGIAALDWRHKLAFWYKRRQTIFTVLLSVIVFTVWDLLAIQQGIFIHGDSEYALDYTIVPEFPIEELFFLTLLCYCTIVIYRAGVKKWAHI